MVTQGDVVVGVVVVGTVVVVVVAGAVAGRGRDRTGARCGTGRPGPVEGGDHLRVVVLHAQRPDADAPHGVVGRQLGQLEESQRVLEERLVPLGPDLIAGPAGGGGRIPVDRVGAALNLRVEDVG